MTETALREAFRRARRAESFGLDARVMALDRKILGGGVSHGLCSHCVEMLYT